MEFKKSIFILALSAAAINGAGQLSAYDPYGSNTPNNQRSSQATTEDHANIDPDFNHRNNHNANIDEYDVRDDGTLAHRGGGGHGGNWSGHGGNWSGHGGNWGHGNNWDHGNWHGNWNRGNWGGYGYGNYYPSSYDSSYYNNGYYPYDSSYNSSSLYDNYLYNQNAAYWDPYTRTYKYRNQSQTMYQGQPLYNQSVQPSTSTQPIIQNPSQTQNSSQTYR